MNTDNFNDWLTSLRSGDYAQTEGKLFGLIDYSGSTYGYCCLGVGCATMPEKLLTVSWKGEGLAPKEFIEWLGLPMLKRTWDPEAHRGKWVPCKPEDLEGEVFSFDISDDPNARQRASAAEMNDNNRSFNEIADWLDKNRDRLVAFAP